jgi:hypothetical protein
MLIKEESELEDLKHQNKMNNKQLLLLEEGKI